MKNDSELQRDVTAELKWEPSVNAARIGVEVKNGVVTLAGHVLSYAEKHHAERAAQRVAGVKALAVEIDVRVPGIDQRTDGDIAHSAENVLHWLVYLPKDSIKVMVENGWITLSGHVDWEYQRKSAAAAIRYITGVTGLSNQIVIQANVSLSAVKSDIESALKRRAKSDAHQISVAVDGSEVTLTGVVQSWSERDLARNSAWGTPGVRNVVDNLTIV